MYVTRQVASILSSLGLFHSEPSADLQSCLISAVSGDKSRLAFTGKAFYDLLDVKWYNLYYPVIPAAIVYPDSSEEVSAAVKCAGEAGLKVQARSGGHGYGNFCLGGINGAIVIDLKNLNSVLYDPTTETASVGPGCRLSDLDNSIIKAGRAVPHGTAPQVGVGGHFTVGGLGPLSRQYGTAADQIVSAEVVLANGSIITASQEQSPDVLFALQGAGASFGIVTNIVVKTYEMPSNAVQFTYNVTLGNSTVQASAFKAYQALITQPDLSRKLSATLSIFDGGVAIIGIFFGSQPEFDALNLEAHLPAGGVLALKIINDAVGVLGEALLSSGLSAGGSIPTHFYSKSLAVGNTTLLSDDAIDAMFAAIDSTDKSGLLWFILFDQQGGAVNDRPADATAYPFRDVAYFIQSYTIDALGFDLQKSRDFLDAVDKTVRSKVPGLAGAYPGYVDPFLDNAQSEYWRENLPRLQRIKARLDPNNLFSNPQSVQGAA